MATITTTETGGFMTRLRPSDLRSVLLAALLASAVGLAPAAGAAPSAVAALAARAVQQDDHPPEDGHAHDGGHEDEGPIGAVQPGHDDEAEHDHALDHGDAHGIDRLVQWIGRFHPVVVHMPIGLIIAAALAELLIMIGGAPWLAGAARFCVAFGALAAAAATPLGWANAAGAEYTDELASVLTLHRWLGTGAAAWVILTLALSEAVRRERFAAWRPWYRLALVAGAVIIGVTGHFGGTLVFGPAYYQW
jgi:uncharacterized membrane protein